MRGVEIIFTDEQNRQAFGHGKIDALGKSPGLPFDNLTFYDPLERKWHSQIATGNRPTPRRDFCAVGVQGPDNTFEVYETELSTH